MTQQMIEPEFDLAKFLKDHTITIPTRNGPSPYLPVNARLYLFRRDCPTGIIETKALYLNMEQGVAVFYATIDDGKGGRATGSGAVDHTTFKDFVEKAETRAVGRALAGLGYGTLLATELDEEGHPVDAPVDLLQKDTVAPLPPAPSVSSAQQTPRPIPVATQTVPTSTAAPVAPKPVPARGRSVTSMTPQSASTKPKTLLSIEECMKQMKELAANIGPYALDQLALDRSDNLQLPKDRKTWTQEQFNKALEYSSQWVMKPWADWCIQAPSQEMKKELQAFQQAMSRDAVSGLTQRLYSVEIAVIDQGEMDKLIKLLREVDFKVALAFQVDPKFAHLITTFKVNHPIDLLNAHRSEQQGTFEIYMAYIRDHLHADQLSESFKIKYGNELTAFQRTPVLV